MRKIGFDNDQYVRLQSERIRQRINKFGGKLYLEFGGKLFDDFHASRVLPGFRPDSKIRMLMEMKAESEVIVAISADDIEQQQAPRRSRHHLRHGGAAPYRRVPRLRAVRRRRRASRTAASRARLSQFQKRLEALDVPVYRHYIIPDYPANLPLIVSRRRLRQERFYRNDPPARRRDRARPRQRQNGDVSFPALS